MGKGIWFYAALGWLAAVWFAQQSLINEVRAEAPAAEAASSDEATPAEPKPATITDDDEVIVTDRPQSARKAVKPKAAPVDEEPSTSESPLEPIPAQLGGSTATSEKEGEKLATPMAKSPAPSTQEGKSLIMRAYQQTRSADNERAYSSIINLCGDGLRAVLPKDTAAYGRKLKAWAHNRRGEVCADTSRQEEALADFTAATELDPTHWRALHNRGVTLAMLGKYDEAIGDFDRTIELNSKYANAFFNRGELLYEQGRFAEAVEDYTESLRLSPKDSAALNSRGHALYRLEKFREAVQDYNESLRLNPENAAALTNRGDIHAEMGNYEQAGLDYRDAITINPGLGRAFQSAAWLMATCPNAKFRNSKLAVEAAQKAIEIDGDADYRYLETLAAAHASAGEFEVAQATQAQVLQVVPKREYERSEKRLELYKKSVPYREAPRQVARTSPGAQPRRTSQF